DTGPGWTRPTRSPPRAAVRLDRDWAFNRFGLDSGDHVAEEIDRGVLEILTFDGNHLVLGYEDIATYLERPGYVPVDDRLAHQLIERLEITVTFDVSKRGDIRTGDCARRERDRHGNPVDIERL